MASVTVVTLDNFYENINEPLARQYFMGNALVRAHGFGPNYPRFTLPIDAADYVSCHHIFCVQDSIGLQPVATFRQVSLRRCDQYHLQPPYLGTTQTSGAKAHCAALQDLVDRCRQDKMDLIYPSGFTVRKDVRSDRDLVALVKELVAALLYLDYHRQTDMRSIAGAALRFGMQPYIEKLGYQPLKWRGKVLPSFAKISAGGEEMIYLELERLSDWTKECFDKHQFVIQSRVLISGSTGTRWDAA